MSTSPPPRSPRRDSSDVALLGAPTEDRAGVRILRARKGRIEVGEIRAAREGQPLTGELVKLHPRAEKPWVCDVEVLYGRADEGPAASDAAAPPPPADDRQSEGRGRPSAVATEAYRENWERIFQVSAVGGKRKRRGDNSMN